MSSIKTQLATLVELQKAENHIQKFEKELAVVDDRILKLDQRVAEFSQQVHATQEQQDQLKKQYRDDEGEVKSIENQVGLSNEKLRSVKTNKEYQSMLKEIDELKKKQSDLEDQMLKTLENIDTSEKEVSIAQADLVDLKAEIDEQKESIRNNAQSQRDALQIANRSREDIFRELDSKTQTLYSKVKLQNGGIGVAGVVEAICQVCRMNIPPQLYIELMRMQNILMCPNCQRIIYPQSLIEEAKANA